MLSIYVHDSFFLFSNTVSLFGSHSTYTFPFLLFCFLFYFFLSPFFFCFLFYKFNFLFLSFIFFLTLLVSPSAPLYIQPFPCSFLSCLFYLLIFFFSSILFLPLRQYSNVNFPGFVNVFSFRVVSGQSFTWTKSSLEAIYVCSEFELSLLRLSDVPRSSMLWKAVLLLCSLIEAMS